jgi:UDP-3-O-[3-hydroxymyristoyl] glucosamine N-acyltransferase
MRTFTAEELARHIGGTVVGEGSIVITGVASIETAREGDIVFAQTPRHFAQAERSSGSCILVPHDIRESRKILIQVENPRLGFSAILALCYPPKRPDPGVHPSAVLGRDVRLGNDVSIGPYAVIGNAVELGDRAAIGPGCVIGDRTVIGRETLLHANVTLYPNCRIGERVTIHSGAVVGSDGFGYVWDGTRHVKIVQVGNTLIDDDVEIGANTCVDRAMLGSTMIARGAKIDNLVQVAHNVTVGQHAVLAGQVGIAGSSKIGAGCVLAGQVGVADHVIIGDGAVVGGKSCVFAGKHIKEGEVVMGYPTRPIQKAKEQLAALALLPKLLRDFAELRRTVAEVRAQLVQQSP